MTEWDGIENLCFVDVETRSTKNVVDHGAWQHTTHGRVTIFAYAFGHEPVQEWLLTDWSPGNKLDWRNAPDDLAAFLQRVKNDKAKFVSWNAGFEVQAFRHAMNGLRFREYWILDAMVQATRSHLPADLLGASMVAKVKALKHADGKRLIKMFADESLSHTPQTDPKDWERFRAYARDDVNAMREIFLGTLALAEREWNDYWVSERINNRGVPLDIPFVEKAAALAEYAAKKANEDVARLTDGVVTSVYQTARMLDWIRVRLMHLPEADRILTREYVDVADVDGGDVTYLPKFSLERPRVEELITYLERVDAEQGLTDDEHAARQLLETRLYGASATPKKFCKALRMADSDGQLKGQYVFCGAAATTRFSSRALQVHNLTRSTIGAHQDETDAINIILDTEDVADAYAKLESHFGPVGRTLSRLIRPAFLAPRGKTFVWADFSAIEARILPWLADSPSARRMLDVFRENDSDPSLPDIYKVQAASILHKPPHDVTKAERQAYGKVPVLSLGYLGGRGALLAMARAYGVSFTENEAQDIIDKWRAQNTWAMNFGYAMWDAVLQCMNQPGLTRSIGRILFLYDPLYIDGTLFIILPDETWLSYPAIRWAERERKNKLTGVVEVKNQLTYRSGRSRIALWPGQISNNVTQGTAACLLRHVLRTVDGDGKYEVVLHTHDECAVLVDRNHSAEAAEYLVRVMETPPDWAESLPLKAEATINEWYSKAVED